MKKKPGPKATVVAPVEGAFDEVVELIRTARQQAVRAVNTELIELYWRIGDYLHRKIESDGWAKGTVIQLAAYIAQREPGLRGFSPQNLWRMRQFFVAYRDDPKLSPLVRGLPWTHNLIVLGQSKRPEERAFYLRMAVQERWSKRELERQFRLAAFERAVLHPPTLSPAVRQDHGGAASVFKDAYVVEFLNLPDEHSEADLHRGLLARLKAFLIELGRDFCFVGSEYPVQVGGRDFALDLLFFHRGLNCLVAIELKVDRFEPEYLDGQQRLTTVSLLIEALARALGDGEPVDGFSAAKLRHYYLSNPLESGDRYFKLLLSQTDNASLKAVIKHTEQPPEPSLRVTQNFDLFTELLAEQKGDLAPVCRPSVLRVARLWCCAPDSTLEALASTNLWSTAVSRAASERQPLRRTQIHRAA